MSITHDTIGDCCKQSTLRFVAVSGDADEYPRGSHRMHTTMSKMNKKPYLVRIQPPRLQPRQPKLLNLTWAGLQRYPSIDRDFARFNEFFSILYYFFEEYLDAPRAAAVVAVKYFVILFYSVLVHLIQVGVSPYNRPLMPLNNRNYHFNIH